MIPVSEFLKILTRCASQIYTIDSSECVAAIDIIDLFMFTFGNL